MINHLIDLYTKHYGYTPDKIDRIAQGGSNRVYYRMLHSDIESVIGTIGTDLKENIAFITLSRHFHQHSINVPKIIAVNNDSSCYIQEDLGDKSLFSQLNSENANDLIEKTIISLTRIQSVKGIDYNICYPQPKFNRQMIMWDLYYFKYSFLKACSRHEIDEIGLENDFNTLCQQLLDTPKSMWGFMYRDCQSRNVIIHNDEPYWIDFQGGRYGPALYDLASLLWQAKANFSEQLRNDMVDKYIDEYTKINNTDRKEMRNRIPIFVLFRTLQVLGAYGFRGLIQRKAHFLQSIPHAISNLQQLLDSGICELYPTLKGHILDLCENPRFKSDSYEGLTVSIFSFSYKKGYPEDLTGNGGGYMFDCRAMHNPGRYEEYRNLTGLDRQVIEFLENQGEVQPFLQSAWSMVEPSVSRYIKRGFTNLQIGFGCTGGQHRSVYCAESTANHLAAIFPDLRIRLIHREQNIDRIIQNIASE